jgi:hypothetical protein
MHSSLIYKTLDSSSKQQIHLEMLIYVYNLK